MKYYINGFVENPNYFFGVGNFSQEEIAKLKSGEVVEKNGNSFWITEKIVIEY